MLPVCFLGFFRRFEGFIGQMLAQHFLVLPDHMLHEFFVFLDITDRLGHIGAVSCGGKQEGHMKLGRLDMAVFPIGEINEFVRKFQKGC